MAPTKMDMTLDATKLAGELTLNVRLRRITEARVRIWVGMLLVRLAVWITGCRLEVVP